MAVGLSGCLGFMPLLTECQYLKSPYKPPRTARHVVLVVSACRRVYVICVGICTNTSPWLYAASWSTLFVQLLVAFGMCFLMSMVAMNKLRQQF